MLILKLLILVHGSSILVLVVSGFVLIPMYSKPADLAILKSLPTDSRGVEQEIVEVFSQKDDYISDFEFTPIHIAVLELYDPQDLDRPTLEQ